MINSHYHFDHVGGNKYCAGATTLAHERELAASHDHQPFERLGYSDLSFDEIGPRYEMLTGDTEIARGLHVFEMPGHTAGHVSLMVEPGGRRPMLFAGDAIYTRQSLEKTIIAEFHYDPVASVASMRRLAALAAEHDAELLWNVRGPGRGGRGGCIGGRSGAGSARRRGTSGHQRSAVPPGKAAA